MWERISAEDVCAFTILLFEAGDAAEDSSAKHSERFRQLHQGNDGQWPIAAIRIQWPARDSENSVAAAAERPLASIANLPNDSD